jgi:hypothetical protein
MYSHAELDRIKRGLQELEKKQIKVGLNKGLPQTVLDRGFFTEYGTEHIPEYAWQRVAVNLNKKDIHKAMRKAAKDMILDNDFDNSRLNEPGEITAKIMKNEIQRVKSPENKPATVKRKGFNKPLIETWLMHDSINYKVEDK